MNKAWSILVLSIALAGCQPDEPPITTEPEMPETAPTGDPGDFESYVESARRDLAGRLDVTPDEVRLVDAESVIWRDGSLGCPEPGSMYTQALVPGYRVRLEVAGTTFHYHGASGRNPMYCPKERVVQPLTDGADRR